MSATGVVVGHARWCVIEGDCTEVIPTLPVVDHVITDPPYDAHTHRQAKCADAAGGRAGVAFASLASPQSTARLLLGAAHRWVLAFCAVEQIGDYAVGAGRAWVRAGIWDKVAPSPQISGDRPGQAVEAIAIMHAPGPKRWNRGGGAGIWRHLAPKGADRPAHPTPKPVDLMVALIADFTDPGDLVLDPFCGSGTTGVAALRLGRRFIGVERDPEWAALSRDRIEAEEQGSTLQAKRAGQTALFGGDQ